MEYPRHYSPSDRSVQSLPPIRNKFRKNNNSQNKSVKSLGSSNSSSNLFSQNVLAPVGNKPLEREKTQADIMENNLNSNKNNLNIIEEIEDQTSKPNMNKLIYWHHLFFHYSKYKFH